MDGGRCRVGTRKPRSSPGSQQHASQPTGTRKPSICLLPCPRRDQSIHCVACHHLHFQASCPRMRETSMSALLRRASVLAPPPRACSPMLPFRRSVAVPTKDTTAVSIYQHCERHGTSSDQLRLASGCLSCVGHFASMSSSNVQRCSLLVSNGAK
jgi:hypothetical protein